MGCEESKLGRVDYDRPFYSDAEWARYQEDLRVSSRRCRALLSRLPDIKRNSGLTLEASACYKPKDGSLNGEDSYFIELPALGVADGIGSSKQHLGYTSKAFADDLMKSCANQIANFSMKHGIDNNEKANQEEQKHEEHAKLAHENQTYSPTRTFLKGLPPFPFNGNKANEGWARSNSNPSPSQVAKTILCNAYREVRSFGSATALVAFFDVASNRLGIASLGDSGLMIIRRSTQRHWQYIMPVNESENGFNSEETLNIIFQSPSQQHSFNVPFQLANLPEEVLSTLSESPDRPEVAQTFDVIVEEGDLILLFSDGVTDNLSNSEILQLCDRFSPYAVYALSLSEDLVTDSQTIAESIVMAAYKKSGDEATRTPFTEEALRADWPLEACIGGKVDDITCMAAWVTHRS